MARTRLSGVRANDDRNIRVNISIANELQYLRGDEDAVDHWGVRERNVEHTISEWIGEDIHCVL